MPPSAEAIAELYYYIAETEAGSWELGAKGAGDWRRWRRKPPTCVKESFKINDRRTPIPIPDPDTHVETETKTLLPQRVGASWVPWLHNYPQSGAHGRSQ